MLVLGIESTCDETACAVVKDGKEILSNCISSQIDLHQAYGGVVPELASRRHNDMMIPVVDQALAEAQVTLEEVDLIAVAHGPGLIGSLLIGINTAKTLSLALNKPLIGVNHVEAHLYSAIMSNDSVSFPCLGGVLSGGHTSLMRVDGIGDYTLISNTVDDAIGEAFDKVAKILELPYPGGPEIEKLALLGDPNAYTLKAGQVKGKPLHFSFSGLKTGVLYSVKGQNGQGEIALTQQQKCDLAASFQQVAVKDIIDKTVRAAQEMNCNTLLLGGGVTNNRYLRDQFSKTPFTIHWPKASLTTDNAAMIAGLGYHSYLKEGPSDLRTLEAKTSFSLNVN